MAILLDMTRAHVPVLAGELIDLTAPARRARTPWTAPSARAATRAWWPTGSAPGGTLVCIDRDPAAEERFEELAAEVACETRFLRMDYVDGLALLADEGFGADLVYLDLGISSMQVDARERGFSYSYDAPLDMRMDPSQELDARDDREQLGRAPARQIFAAYGEEPNARAIAREIVAPARARADRDHRRAGGGDRGRAARRRAAQVRRRSPGQARLPGHADRGERRARVDLDRALPAAWELLRPGGRLAAISFHSLEDRRVKRFLADRARGCICPPDFPVCVCGHEPEAELLTRPRRGAHARRGGREPALRAPAACAPPGKLAAGEPPDGARRRARSAAPRRPRGAAPAAAPAQAPAPQRAPRRAQPAPRRRRSPAPQPRRDRARSARRAHARRAATGRGWIGLVGVLLAGIVFFNVDLLQMNREITQTADRAAAVKRENARLRTDVARLAAASASRRPPPGGPRAARRRARCAT